MKVYVRTGWSDYEEVRLEDLQEAIDYECDTFYKIDEISDDAIYICKITEGE